MRRIIGVLCVLLCIGIFHSQTHAQTDTRQKGVADYPNRPITIIVCVPPGGTADVEARALASVVEKLLGQPVVVVNKPGASGQTGLLTALQAAPDGYTLVMASCAYLFPSEWEMANGRKPHVMRNEFVEAGTFSRARFMITVPYNSPWKTLPDLIKDAKANPGKYAFGSGGFNSLHHLLAEIFIAHSGLKFRHVPHTGGGPIVNALLGNHIDFAVASGGSTYPQVRANKLRYLAVIGDKRYGLIPDTPTPKEFGVDAEFLDIWLGIWAAKNTPEPIVRRLEEALKKAVEDKSFIKVVEGVGDEVHHMTSKEMTQSVDRDLSKVKKMFLQFVAEGKK
jgi:tripartite-type tricarboxylate transporter receptor subunit TctC